MILKIILAVVAVLVMIEWYMVRKARVIRHIKTGQNPSIDSFWFSKIELLWIVLSKRSFTQLGYDRVDREEFEDVRVRYTMTDIAVMVTSPEGVKAIMSQQQTDKIALGQRHQQNPHFEKILGNSLLLQSGKKATSTRSIMNPAFKRKKLRSLVPHFVQVTNEMIRLMKERHKDGEVVQMERWLKNLTYDVIGKTAFGHDFNSLDRPSEEVEELELCFAGMVQPLAMLFGPIATKMPTEYQRKLTQARVKSSKTIADVINQRKEANLQGGDVKETDAKDLLDLILDADTDGLLTTDELVQNTYLFFLAGQETSAGSLVSALYFLSRNPECQQRAYEEAVSVVQGDEINADHVDELKYIEACLKECLRLFAPVDGTMPRTVTEDMVISDYLIPKGTTVFVNWARMHRSSKFWEAPKEFRPERWLGSDAASASSLMSFAAGPRVCIGKNFAMMEMKIVLASLLLNYTWTLPEDFEFQIAPFTITVTPKGGLPVKFTRR